MSFCRSRSRPSAGSSSPVALLDGVLSHTRVGKARRIAVDRQRHVEQRHHAHRTRSFAKLQSRVKDGVNAQLTVSILSVSSDYKLADVKTQVTDMLKEIGQYNYSQWTTTNLAERTLRAIEKNRAENRLMIVSSHLVDEMEDMIDDALFMKDGKAVLLGSREELERTQGANIVELYKRVYGEGEAMIHG